MIVQTLLKRTIAQAPNISATIPTFISFAGAILPIGIMVGHFLPHRSEWTPWSGMLLVREGAFMRFAYL